MSVDNGKPPYRKAPEATSAGKERPMAEPDSTASVARSQSLLAYYRTNQEQVAARAEDLARPNLWDTGQLSWKATLPCPSCGVSMVMGYLFLTPDDGQHQHTHYVCLSWPRGGDRCGWHGWVVPGWDDDEPANASLPTSGNAGSSAE